MTTVVQAITPSGTEQVPDDGSDEVARLDFRTAERCFSIEIHIVPSEDGGFEAYAARLPGLATQGENLDEALTHAREAAQGVLASYLDAGQAIPWVDEQAAEQVPAGAIVRWIVVDA